MASSSSGNSGIWSPEDVIAFAMANAAAGGLAGSLSGGSSGSAAPSYSNGYVTGSVVPSYNGVSSYAEGVPSYSGGGGGMASLPDSSVEEPTTYDGTVFDLSPGYTYSASPTSPSANPYSNVIDYLNQNGVNVYGPYLSDPLNGNLNSNGSPPAPIEMGGDQTPSNGTVIPNGGSQYSPYDYNDPNGWVKNSYNYNPSTGNYGTGDEVAE